jgi:hypothetical protein
MCVQFTRERKEDIPVSLSAVAVVVCTQKEARLRIRERERTTGDVGAGIRQVKERGREKKPAIAPCSCQSYFPNCQVGRVSLSLSLSL